MNGSLVEGPGRHLRALRGRLMVELAKGEEEERYGRLHPQHQQVRERLQKSLIATRAESIGATPEMAALQMLESLSRQSPPGHLALSLTAQALARRSQRLVERGVCAPFAQALEVTAGHYQHTAARLETQLRQSDLLAAAQRHVSEVMARWKNGEFNGWSPAGRCYVVLEELRWGAFGDALRLGEPQEKTPCCNRCITRPSADWRRALTRRPTRGISTSNGCIRRRSRACLSIKICSAGWVRCMTASASRSAGR